MEIFEFEQMSDEWMRARIGSIGGSSIASVCAKGKGKTRTNLLYRFAGEILSGQKYESYQNAHMQRGIEQEPDARNLFEFETGLEAHQVGLVRHSEKKHYSPDALIGDCGLAEIKCVIPSVHVETIIKNKVPPEYYKQIQWGLFICQCEWAKFISYSPLIIQRPLFVVHVERDEELIDELNAEADKFISELNTIVNKIEFPYTVF